MLVRTARQIDTLKVKARECSQLDNVLREGYLSASEEYKLLTRSGEVYNSWVEKVKKYQGRQSRSEIENMKIDFKENLDILDYKATIDERIKELEKEIQYNDSQRESILNDIKDSIEYNRKNTEGGKEE